MGVGGGSRPRRNQLRAEGTTPAAAVRGGGRPAQMPVAERVPGRQRDHQPGSAEDGRATDGQLGRGLEATEGRRAHPGSAAAHRPAQRRRLVRSVLRHALTISLSVSVTLQKVNAWATSQ